MRTLLSLYNNLHALRYQPKNQFIIRYVGVKHVVKEALVCPVFSEIALAYK